MQMKSMLVAALSTLMLCAFAEAKKKPHLEHYELKGPVRSVTEERVGLYETEEKRTEAETEFRATMTFDVAGKLLELINYAPDPDGGKLRKAFRFVYSYDSEGRRTKKEFRYIPRATTRDEGPIPEEETPPRQCVRLMGLMFK
jgi:hypothetical protein